MDVNPKSRRRHSAEFKAQVVAACTEPGASVAAVARAFGLNDNLVHDWRRGRSGAGVSKAIGTSLQESPPEFVALSLPSSPPSPSPAPAVAPEGIRIDALWLCTKPADMRCGAERLLAHVVHTLGSANAHHGYLNDVLTRLPTHLNSRIDELLPHNWRSSR